MSTELDELAEAGRELYRAAITAGDTSLCKTALEVIETAKSIETSPSNQGRKGTILKGTAREEDQFILTIAWPADRLTKRGADGYVDVASPRAVEQAAWSFALKGSKTGVGHKPGGEDACRVVESSVWRAPDWHIEAPDGSVQVVRKGDWLVGLVLSDHAWELYKAGKLAGVSMQGKATRRPASAQTLASLRG